MAAGLLAAADRGEGATLYRYHEPAGEGARAREQARARLARRFRLAPPGAAELRQRLGLHALHQGPGGGALAGGGRGPGGATRLPGDEDDELGFTVVATDSACRPAVGAVALPPAPAGTGDAAGAAHAAAVLDATGQLRLLRQRWPRSEPALHQLDAWQLGEPAVALLPGSLAYQGGPGSSTDRTGMVGSAAGYAGGTQEMVAVTAAGGAVALLPLETWQAERLSLLQQALLQHPAAVPLAGGSAAAFRGAGAIGGSSGGSPAVAYVHPPPPAPDPGMADVLASLPGAPTGAASAGAAGSPSGLRGEQVEGPGCSTPQRGTADGRPGSGSSVAGSGQAQRTQQAAPDMILDAELLQQYLLMPPAEQRHLLAAAGVAGSDGAAQLAAQLTNLVAQLVF